MTGYLSGVWFGLLIGHQGKFGHHHGLKMAAIPPHLGTIRDLNHVAARLWGLVHDDTGTPCFVHFIKNSVGMSFV